MSRTAAAWLVLVCLWGAPYGPARAADATLWVEARTAFIEGRYEQVLALSEHLPLDAELALLRAHALANLGRHAQALAECATLPETWPAEVRARIELDRRTWESALEARERARAAKATEPPSASAAPPKLSPAERLALAQKLIEARKHQEALTELARLPRALAKAERAELAHLRGTAFFRLRTRYPEAARELARASQLDPARFAEDEFLAARALSRADRDGAAIVAYRAFAARRKQHDKAPEALFLAAWLESRIHAKRGQKSLEKFVLSPLAQNAPKLVLDARWQLGWLAFEAKQSKRAAQAFDAYADATDSAFERARGRYFAGRAAQLGKDESAARAHFEATLSADPHGYYAELAAAKLRTLGTTPAPIVDEKLAAELRAPTQSAPEAASFFARLGLFEQARALLPSSLQNAERAAVLLTLGDSAGAYRGVRGKEARALAAGLTESTRWLWHALFPRPYAELVRALELEHDLPEHLLHAHMRIESSYDPEAISYADALGLMQLLPSTAEAVAKGTGLAVTREALHSPWLNVTLAARYLAGLVRHYQGQLPLAIAAYNAGTERVDGWLKACDGAELDIFVEEIPVEQTRNYVRRVLGAWARYRTLYGELEPYSLPVPARVWLKPRS